MKRAQRLFVLDDEKAFADLVATVGRQMGYDAFAMTTAKEFYAQYLAAPPDFIVMDIVMPDVDGIEVVRWLVEQECSSRVLLVSGYSPAYAKVAEIIGRTGGMRFVGKLDKPMSVANLRASLELGLAD